MPDVIVDRDDFTGVKHYRLIRDNLGSVRLVVNVETGELSDRIDYDEWGNVAAAIYEALIVEPQRSSFPEAEREHFSLPDYDMLFPTYAGKSIIEVLSCLRVPTERSGYSTRSGRPRHPSTS